MKKQPLGRVHQFGFLRRNSKERIIEGSNVLQICCLIYSVVFGLHPINSEEFYGIQHSLPAQCSNAVPSFMENFGQLLQTGSERQLD
ncbi:hypothetical protein MHH78_24175 [Paenibacillus sp. FSL H3-0333]|uniref:hypothetical protein n=1 Tax=Paenibacillus sp. FSL H3-0333 TaxID=2921373 RepID=UPI0030F77C14